MKKALIVAILLLCSRIATAQTLKGHLKHHAGQHISLTGFNYYDGYELAKTIVDSLGDFTLNYPKDYNGMGVLKAQDNSSFILVLTEPNIELIGTHMQNPDSLSFANSIANTNFVNYAKAQGLHNNAMSALKYLDDLYQKEHLFTNRKKIKKAIKKEQACIIKESTSFIKNLDRESYLRWFIPYRKLIQDMPTIVRTETQRIPEAITKFRTTDFNHPNFKTSGLFKELIEGHYLLLENMGQPLDSIYKQMNISSDYLVNILKAKPTLLKVTSQELFTFFEKRSLFTVASHLSQNLITNYSEVLDDILRAKMERYVSLKVGNIAPNITLTKTKKLKDINTNILLVFGESGCSHCVDDKKRLLDYYQQWKTKYTIEVVYVSLDSNKDEFNALYGNTPWKTYCDYKGWDTKAVKAYYVNATPTYFLLDKDLKILLHPRSLAHVNAWANINL